MLTNLGYCIHNILHMHYTENSETNVKKIYTTHSLKIIKLTLKIWSF